MFFALYLAAVSPSFPALLPLPFFCCVPSPANFFGQTIQSRQARYFIHEQKIYHIEVAALGHWF